MALRNVQPHRGTRTMNPSSIQFYSKRGTMRNSTKMLKSNCRVISSPNALATLPRKRARMLKAPQKLPNPLSRRRKLGRTTHRSEHESMAGPDRRKPRCCCFSHPKATAFYMSDISSPLSELKNELILFQKQHILYGVCLKSWQ